MRRAFVAIGAVAIGAAGSIIYWQGAALRAIPHASSLLAFVRADEAARSAEPSSDSKKGKILYYRDPMGKPDYSPVPKKDPMGMDYVPVYEGDEDSGSKEAQPTAPASKSEARILYYRNPMGLPDTSPVPKKDSMGMDYIPVYEGEGEDDGTVKISLARVQKLGVRSATVEMRNLTRTIAAVGTVQPDERRLFIVNTKFEGWIDKLHVDATGQAVRRGQPLMEIYAPELVIAEQEYQLAWQSFATMAGAPSDVRASAEQLADSALQRLRNWDISNDQIRRIQRGTITRTLTLRSPADGVVLEKMAIQGMHFTAGEPLYRIADLTKVWLIADVFEQDLGALRPAEDAKITVNAYAGETFTGKVDFVYPTVKQDTRTGKVRIVMDNPDGRLKPGMYAKVSLESTIGAVSVLAIPESAVLDSGTRQTVLVERGEGRYEPRGVKLGAHADGYYAVIDGLTPGERVVVSANFLIDAESNLRAALKTFSPPANGEGASSTNPPPARGGKS